MKREINAALQDALKLLQRVIADGEAAEEIELLSKHMAEVFAEAMHFAEEFTGRFRSDRIALPVIALTDPSHITCVGNDYGFDQVFARGVEAYGDPGDIFIGLSTSGNSPNVINASNRAFEMGLTRVLLLGKDGGKLEGNGDFEFIVPATTSDRIQEVHMMLLHILIEAVERRLFPKLYKKV
jgi:D-sedoheptulose 7-phosphate isomerase